jgi:hypothetical protein
MKTIKSVNGRWNPSIKSQETFSEYRFVRPDGSGVFAMGQAIPERNIKK